MIMQELIETSFAEAVGLSREAVFTSNLSLAEIIKRSSRLTNSIDLMEAFARTAGVLRRTYNIRVRLPSFPLDTAIAEVFAAFNGEAEKQLALVTPTEVL